MRNEANDSRLPLSEGCDTRELINCCATESTSKLIADATEASSFLFRHWHTFRLIPQSLWFSLSPCSLRKHVKNNFSNEIEATPLLKNRSGPMPSWIFVLVKGRVLELLALFFMDKHVFRHSSLVIPLKEETEPFLVMCNVM